MMKIDSTYKPPVAPASPRSSPQPAAEPADTQDAVSLSVLAGSLKGSDGAPVNTARVQEIKQAISEGRFRINPEAIADRLIQTAQELVGNPNQRAA